MGGGRGPAEGAGESRPATGAPGPAAVLASGVAADRGRLVDLQRAAVPFRHPARARGAPPASGGGPALPLRRPARLRGARTDGRVRHERRTAGGVRRDHRRQRHRWPGVRRVPGRLGAAGARARTARCRRRQQSGLPAPRRLRIRRRRALFGRLRSRRHPPRGAARAGAGGPGAVPGAGSRRLRRAVLPRHDGPGPGRLAGVHRPDVCGVPRRRGRHPHLHRHLCAARRGAARLAPRPFRAGRRAGGCRRALRRECCAGPAGRSPRCSRTARCPSVPGRRSPRSPATTGLRRPVWMSPGTSRSSTTTCAVRAIPRAAGSSWPPHSSRRWRPRAANCAPAPGWSASSWRTAGPLGCGWPTGAASGLPWWSPAPTTCGRCSTSRGPSTSPRSTCGGPVRRACATRWPSSTPRLRRPSPAPCRRTCGGTAAGTSTRPTRSCRRGTRAASPSSSSPPPRPRTPAPRTPARPATTTFRS